MRRLECIRRVVLLLIVLAMIMAGVLYNFFEVNKIVLQSIGGGILFLFVLMWIAKGIYEKRKRCIYHVLYDGDKSGRIKSNFDAIGSHLVGNGIFYDGREEDILFRQLQMYVDKKDVQKAKEIIELLLKK